MATLLLTAAGTALGGPIGGAIGAIVGQSIDSTLLKPKGRQGPRLGDLAVQTSSYGTAIPKLFGTIRVAGTVIWATDLREERNRSGGGKGRPSTTSYSYSASFAVALSGRPIRTVRRIWADGKLLRGAVGDFKSATGYRLHLGDEEQDVDPLIAAAEGIGQAPAFRGVAYAIFEDFQLADYGNRIPSLTFEVEADAGAVAIGVIAETLTAGAVVDGQTPAILGYAASGDSLRGAIEALGDIVPLSFSDRGDALVALPETVPAALAGPSLGAAAGETGGAGEIRRQAAGLIPAEAGISYYDPARDYQTGLQRATRGGPALRSDQRAIAAVMEAGTAKAFVEARLAALWAGRATATLHLPWRESSFRPGAVLHLPGQAGPWRIERWTFERMVISLELRKLPVAAPTAAEAGAGRPAENPDLAHGGTHLALLDLPLGVEELPTRARLFAAAAGDEAGWRRAALMASLDGGASWDALGAQPQPAIMGRSLNALEPASSAMFDDKGELEVELLNETMWLEGRSDAALAGGANLAALGRELLQFGRAEPLGGNRFRLTRLLRGRLGTEWASEHSADDAFVLIERESLALIEPGAGALGAEARLLASGLGDGPEGVSAATFVTGEAIRPPSPVHLRAERRADGAIAIGWTRRSRNGWAWLDSAEAPLGEQSKAYRLTLSGAGFERSVELPDSGFLYSAGAQAADGLTGPLTISVAQLGSLAASREARLILTTD